jgi:hypothetical protein
MLFEYRIWLIPLRIARAHYVALGVDFINKKILYYDSRNDVYGVPKEDIRFVIDLLKHDLGSLNEVLSDWCILEGMFLNMDDDAMVAKSWGVDHLSLEQRIIKALDAGVDQFGGDIYVDALIKAVASGRIP